MPERVLASPPMPEIVWINGHIHPREEAVISVFDHGFLYGDSIYETVRTSGGRPFLLQRHLERLRASAAALHLDLNRTLEEDRLAVDEALAAAANPESILRIIVTRGEGDIGYGRDLCRRPSTLIYVRPMKPLQNPDTRPGIKVVILSILRNDPRTVSPAIKSGNLLNNILGAHEAEERGVEEGIMLNPAGQVAEGTMTNLFIVKNGVVRTPPLEDGILPGITRGFVLELARETGVPVREESFPPADLLAADEAFLTGTTRAVQPILSVDDVRLGDGRRGPITYRLMKAFAEAETRLVAAGDHGATSS